MKPEYEPKTDADMLAYFVEECGEALAAVEKTLRWGQMAYNPELPVGKRETNRDWALRELRDLEMAIGFARTALGSGEAPQTRIADLELRLAAAERAINLLRRVVR